MRDADAFEETAFLGLSKNSKRDPYRLALFAAHLDADERPRVLLAVQGGTLIITDCRVLELRAHLDVRGAWNVKEFQGYEVRRAFDRSAVRGVEHRVGPLASGPVGTIEDALEFELSARRETVVVSRGPEGTLSAEDFESLRAALRAQPK